MENKFSRTGDSRSGSKAEDAGKRGEREREKERLNDGNNNDRATHGARKHVSLNSWVQSFSQLAFQYLFNLNRYLDRFF